MNKPKKITAWLEIHETYADAPTIMHTKPSKRYIKNANDIGYQVFKCEIVFKEEIIK